MAFLTLNEITIPVSVEDTKEEVQYLGEMEHADSGKLLETRQAEVRVFFGKTTLLENAEGEALKRLLKGQGYHWSFDSDTYSDGKKLAGTEEGTVTAGTASGKFDAHLVLDAETSGGAADGGRITYGAGLTNKYTVMFWHYNGSTWDHWAMWDDGSYWKNGTSTGTTPPGVSVDGSGNLVLGDRTTEYKLDDVVALPFRLATSWLEGELGPPTQAWSDMPHLLMNGDFSNNEQVEVQCREPRVIPQGRRNTSGTWEKYGHIIQFELVETL